MQVQVAALPASGAGEGRTMLLGSGKVFGPSTGDRHAGVACTTGVWSLVAEAALQNIGVSAPPTGRVNSKRCSGKGTPAARLNGPMSTAGAEGDVQFF